MPTDLTFDFTARTYDANGWLHIARSHISKAAVNPYYGREIPGMEGLGLQADKLYYLLRAPEELEKAADSFKGIPLLNKHIALSTFDTLDEAEKKKHIVGCVGSDVQFLAPYLDADTTVWDASAIAGIETEVQREHSCSYRYVPIMTTGTFEGQKYDGIMTQIQANHLCLVESGRAGNDVLAADVIPEREPMKRSKLGNALIVALTTAFPKVKIAADSEAEKFFAPAARKTFDKVAAKKLVLAMDADIPDTQVTAVMDALVDVDDPEPTKKTNEEEERAKDKKAKDSKRAADASGHPEGCMCGDCKTARDADPEEMTDAEKKAAAKDKKAKDAAAKDAEPASKSEMKGAMDELETKLRGDFKDAEEAKREVRPVVGDVIAMDTASNIYAFALDQMKVDHKGIEDLTALRALFKLAREREAVAVPAHVAMDSATAETQFKDLARFRTV